MMKRFLIGAAGASMLALAACGGEGDDSLGDNAADSAEAQAEQLEEAADNAVNGTQEEQLEDAADAVEEMGAGTEEAIDDADVQVNQQ